MSRNSHVNRRLADIFARRKLMMASIFTFVVVSGMVTTLLITPKFEATMSILVSRDRIDPQISSSDKNGEITQTVISDEEFNSELELVRSIEVLKGAVNELNLVRDTSPKPDTWLADIRGRVKSAIYGLAARAAAKTPEADSSAPVNSANDNFELEKAVNRVGANLDVVPIKKSRIIKVSYMDTDPIRAKKTLEKIYEKYVELHVRISDRPQAEQVFNEQTQRFNQQLNATTNELKQFDVQNGVSGTEIGTQRELMLKQLYDTQAQFSSTQTEIGETEQRITALRSKIDSMPEQIQTSSVSRYVGALDDMKAELVKLERERTDLMQKYKPNSRFVRENNERIQQLNSRIASETANPPQEKSYALNDLRRKLEAELNEAQTRIVGLRKREKSLEARAAKLSSDVVALNTKSIERDDIARKRSVNEEAYLLYQKKARENEVSQVLNKEQIVNFGIVDPPRTDGDQKTPKPLLNLIILIAVGAVASLGSAMILSMGNRPEAYDNPRLLSALDFEKHFGLPILAHIPEIDKGAGEKLSLNP
ncbi:MAG: GumC family protein [Pyrinomonadaceae bacterium]